jgi:hypothetical protein
MLGRNLLKRIARLKRRNEHALLIRGPGSTNIVRQLRASVRPGRHLFQCRNAGKQCSEHLGLLQDCGRGELLASERIDSLDESLKYFPSAVDLHERTFHGD